MKTTRIVKIGTEDRIKELKSKLAADPFNVNLRLMLAQQFDAIGRPAEALKELEATITKARRNLGVAYCSYAVSLMNAKQPDLALMNFDHAIEIDPANASFYLSNKARLLSDVGLTDKAKAIYDQILQKPQVSKETRRIVMKNRQDLEKS